jgi:TatA/E family protein of Tat protein translocase
MFNLGFPEMLVIGAAALLLFGPKRLPELAKGLGKGIRDFKKALAGEDEESTPQIPKAPPGQTVAQGDKKIDINEPVKQS